MNYYWISINNRKVSSIAYAPEGTPVAHELIHDVVGKSMLPFPLELHSATDKDYLRIGGVSDLFFDYQPNSLAWPIMSERMKTIIESHLSGGECIEWKSVQVRECGPNFIIFAIFGPHSQHYHHRNGALGYNRPSVLTEGGRSGEVSRNIFGNSVGDSSPD